MAGGMSPSLIVDIVLGIVCLIMICKYTAKGFLNTVLGIARLFASVVLAYAFRTPIAKMLNGMFMDEKIFNWVHSSIMERIGGGNATVDFIEIYHTAPDFYDKVLTLFGLNAEELDSGILNLNMSNTEELARTISEPLANMISTVIAVIGVFIIAMIVLHFVVKLLNSITKIKLIGFINRLLGFGLGVVLSAFVVWAVGFGLEFAVNAFGPMYPDVFNEGLTENSMIINALKNMGLLDMFEGVVNDLQAGVPVA